MERTCQKRRNEKRSKSGLSKNRSLTMQDNCEVFTSLIQQLGNSRNHSKCAEKVGRSDASSNALQDERTRVQETCSALGICTTEYACIVEADESTRKRMEGTLHKDHEDHIAEKGINSLNPYNLVHKFVLTPQAMKIPEANGS